MDQLTTVCFTGHREIPPMHALQLPQLLERSLLELIERGATVFRAGGAMGFDTLAALKVLELRETYSAVQLHLYLPCRDQTRGWRERDVEVYRYVLQHADRCVYTSEEYSAGCMQKRNRALVDGSDLCLAYCTHNRGGSFYTCAYACRQDVELQNLADLLPPRV